ncbi:MAG: DUF1559 domain-containing protein [Planctomycetota bacterium]
MRGRKFLDRWLESSPLQLQAMQDLVQDLQYVTMRVDFQEELQCALQLIPLEPQALKTMEGELARQLRQFERAHELVSSRLKSVNSSLADLVFDLAAELSRDESSVSISLRVDAAEREVSDNLEQLAETLADFREEQERMAPLQRIGEALHRYHSKYRMFPPAEKEAKFDANGKPSMSWRVHLLPFLGQRDVYDRLRLDEKWDSKHNLPILQSCKNEFAMPGADPDSTLTPFLAFQGKDRFVGRGSGKRLREFLDGIGNTVCIVQVGKEQEVVWYEPTNDLAIDGDLPSKIGRSSQTGVRACFASGSVGYVKHGQDHSTWNALTTINGKEPLQLEEILVPPSRDIVKQIGRIFQFSN